MALAQGAAGPGAALRQQLADLAANPQSVDQLVATGRAALALGDGEAALGFFTRAEQLAARDARVKAGLAAANARSGRPETALTLFAEAAALGAPEAELAADRGLAYDMIGQTARAQQDYLAALRHRDDAEVRRRLALSLAISGQRDAALRLIEPQISGGDRAGQRARIMVLALTGDARGASAAANAALPAQAAQSLTPFLTRLASLSPGEMAAAANLGRVPAAGGVRQASVRSQADPGALAFAGGGSSSLSSRLPIALADATPRRRPGGVTGTASAAGATDRNRTTVAARDAGRPRGSWTTVSSTATTRPPEAASASPSTAFLQPHPHEPLRVSREALEPAELAGAAPSGPRIPRAELAEPRSAAAPAAAPIQLATATPYQPQPAAAPTASRPDAQDEPVDGAAANLAVWNSGAAPARGEAAAPVRVEAAPARVETAVPVRAQANITPRAAASSPAAASRPGFSDVVATVSGLPAETTATPVPPRQTASPARTTPRRTQAATPASRPTTPTTATARRTQTAAATRPAAATTRAPNPRQANPARIWVQLGVSNNRAGFGYELTRMRRAAAELRTQTAYTASLGSNHRLLVGPFPTDAAARTFINTLRQRDIPSLAWTSSAGTQVERLPAGR